jgi:hypothetical protein
MKTAVPHAQFCIFRWRRTFPPPFPRILTKYNSPGTLILIPFATASDAIAANALQCAKLCELLSSGTTVALTRQLSSDCHSPITNSAYRVYAQGAGAAAPAKAIFDANLRRVY